MDIPQLEAAKKLAGMILTHPLQPGLKPRELEKFLARATFQPCDNFDLAINFA